jgi:hypothetical protein
MHHLWWKRVQIYKMLAFCKYPYIYIHARAFPPMGVPLIRAWFLSVRGRDLMFTIMG